MIRSIPALNEALKTRRGPTPRGTFGRRRTGLPHAPQAPPRFLLVDRNLQGLRAMTSSFESEVEDKIGVNFKRRETLRLAFVHRSYINEFPADGSESNERLEFF